MKTHFNSCTCTGSWSRKYICMYTFYAAYVCVCMCVCACVRVCVMWMLVIKLFQTISDFKRQELVVGLILVQVAAFPVSQVSTRWKQRPHLCYSVACQHVNHEPMAVRGGAEETPCTVKCISMQGGKTPCTVKCVYQYAGRMLLALALWKPPKYFLSGIHCGSIPQLKVKCMFCFAVYHTHMTAKIQIQYWSQKYCWRKVLFHFHWQQAWRQQQGLEKKTTMDSTHPMQYSVFLQCAIRLNCRLRRTWQCKQRCVGTWTYFSSSSDTTGNKNRWGEL